MTRQELIEKAMRFRADTVKRGSARQRAEIERHVDQFNPHAEDHRKRVGLYSHHQSSRDRGTIWKGKSWAASPGVTSPFSVRKGFDDDIFDAAAVVKGKKPAALMMGGHNARGEAHVRHYLEKGMAKGKIISHPGVIDQETGGIDTTAGGRLGFYFGKRKNVHKLMRMDQRSAQDDSAKKSFSFRKRTPDSRARREHQFGATIGYPKEKVDRFLDRIQTKFDKSFARPKKETIRRRFDVVKLQPGRTIGRNKLGVPIGKLPEEISEASVDYYDKGFRRGVNKAARLYRRFKDEPHNIDRPVYSFGGPGKNLGTVSTRVKGNPYHIDLETTSANKWMGRASSMEMDPFVKGGGRIGTVQLNKDLRLDNDDLNYGRAKAVAGHEFGHIVDPGVNFGHERKAEMPAKGKQPMTKNKFYKDMAYFTRARETHSNVLGTMVGAQAGKEHLGVTGDQARAHLRTMFRGGFEKSPGADNFLKADDYAPEKMRAVGAYTTGLDNMGLRMRRIALSKSQKSTVSPKERKRRGHKYFKEIHKGIEMLYGPQKKGRLPEGVDEASIDHITPDIRRQASELETMYRKTPNEKGGKGIRGLLDTLDKNFVTGQRIGSIRSKSTITGRDYKVNLHTRRFGIPYLAPSGVRGASKAISPEMLKDKVRDIALPRARRSVREKNRGLNKGVIAHELLHTGDPRTNLTAIAARSVSRKEPSYINQAHERHSFNAVAGTYGTEALKKGGVAAKDARAWLRRADKTKKPKVKGSENKGSAGLHLLRPMLRMQTATKYETMDPKGSHASERALSHKNYRKMAKEVHKGMERTYGSEWAANRKLPA